MRVFMIIVMKLPLIGEKKCMHFMKIIGLKVAFNTITKIFVNIMFHSTMALRTILVKTILT